MPSGFDMAEWLKDRRAAEAKRKQEWEARRPELFQKIRDRGATSASLEFSGGHDEGHVSSCTLNDEHGVLVEELQPYYSGLYIDENGKQQKRETTEKEAEDQELFENLSNPIDQKYGSFAGEFSVDGVLIWDTVNEEIKMQYTEYVEVGEGHEEHF